MSTIDDDDSELDEDSWLDEWDDVDDDDSDLWDDDCLDDED